MNRNDNFELFFSENDLVSNIHHYDVIRCDSINNLIKINSWMNDITAIFAFLKYCLGSKENMSRVITGMDWQELYSFASKQALLGLCFEGIERLGKEYPEELKQNPIGRELLMTWMGKAQQIRR